MFEKNGERETDRQCRVQNTQMLETISVHRPQRYRNCCYWKPPQYPPKHFDTSSTLITYLFNSVIAPFKWMILNLKCCNHDSLKYFGDNNNALIKFIWISYRKCLLMCVLFFEIFEIWDFEISFVQKVEQKYATTGLSFGMTSWSLCNVFQQCTVHKRIPVKRKLCFRVL